jgi:Na+-transporting NADH:ubiquinone oxidoreductase subunit B
MSIFQKMMKKPLDTIHEMAKKGGPLYKFRVPVDANDTFLRTPLLTTKGKVHVRDALDIKRLMTIVIVALIPALLFSFYNIGLQKLSSISDSSFTLTGLEPTFFNIMIHGLWHFLPIIIVSYMAGGLVELFLAMVRDHEVNEGFLVTGMLIPLTMPPDIPLWMVAVGTAFGVFFGKEIFGGTGYNFLNPALTARAFIFFSYPTAISGDQVWRAVDAAKDKLIDGYSGATPLSIAATLENGSNVVEVLKDAGFSFYNMFMGFIPGSAGETSTLAILLGAALLLLTGVASWRIMLSMTLGGLAMASLFFLLRSESSLAFFHLPPYYHLVMGGFAFGTVFMATDPVSAAATQTGRWIYGFLIGVLAVLIRVINPAFPEGVMLAILLMNVFAPVFDYFVIKANIKRRRARVAS